MTFITDDNINEQEIGVCLEEFCDNPCVLIIRRTTSMFHGHSSCGSECGTVSQSTCKSAIEIIFKTTGCGTAMNLAEALESTLVLLV
jgi:hypothetical protein